MLDQSNAKAMKLIAMADFALKNLASSKEMCKRAIHAAPGDKQLRSLFEEIKTAIRAD